LRTAATARDGRNFFYRSTPKKIYNWIGRISRCHGLLIKFPEKHEKQQKLFQISYKKMPKLMQWFRQTKTLN
jgi:hypothetical protein